MMLNNSRVIPSKIRTKLFDREKESLESKKKYNDKIVKFRCNYSSTQVQVMLARGWHKVILLSFYERECLCDFREFVRGKTTSLEKETRKESNGLKRITR